MKTKNKITSTLSSLSVLIFLIATLSIQGCKEDVTPSIAEVTTKKITAGGWKIKSVAVDGIDETDFFKNFTLQYTPTTYATTNGTEAWPSSGTWTFKDDTANIILRDDGIEITIESITDTEFVYSLTWTKTTYGPGRVNGLGGEHRFEMVR